jgi:hypothetical protein
VGAFQRTIADEKVKNHSMMTDILALLPECNNVQQPIMEIAAVVAVAALGVQEEEDSDHPDVHV